MFKNLIIFFIVLIQQLNFIDLIRYNKTNCNIEYCFYYYY